MRYTRKNRHNKPMKQPIFTSGDYNASDGMSSNVWGPAMWFYLHTMSFNYPVNPTKQDKHHYKDFIISLQYVLPCKYCRSNIRKNFKQLPLLMSNMKNRDTFSKYIYDLHEVINKMLGKKSGLSYDDVRERYEHFRARCTNDTKPIAPKAPKAPKVIANKTRKKTEKGCTEPLYGKKSKCIINIVPQEEKGASLQIDKKCIKTRE